jgi:hypothetical protein
MGKLEVFFKLLLEAFFYTALSGTFLWLVWPVCRQPFPALPAFTWWQAVCLCMASRMLMPTRAVSEPYKKKLSE